MDNAYISAIAALAGSAIGALASFATRAASRADHLAATQKNPANIARCFTLGGGTGLGRRAWTFNPPPWANAVLTEKSARRAVVTAAAPSSGCRRSVIPLTSKRHRIPISFVLHTGNTRFDKGLDIAMTVASESDVQPHRARSPFALGTDSRRRWMAVLAIAPLEDLEAAWTALPNRPDYRRLRGPDTGLIMVRGRAGGTGSAFNLGEMTVTRCTVQIDEVFVGHSYVAGTNPRHAELAAIFDALMQDLVRGPALEESLIKPLLHNRDNQLRDEFARIASSRVEFFTVVRGEDER